MRPFSLLVAVVGLLAGVCPSRSTAQDTKPEGAEALSVKGTIDALEPMLRIKVSETELWVIQIKPDQTKIEVTGTAEPAYLRSGLTVRFSGEIDKKGTLQADVDELQLFTPQGKNGLGLFVDDSPTAKPIGKLAPGKYEIRAKVLSLKEHDLVLVAGNKKIFGTLAADATVNVASDDFSYVHDGDAVTVTGWYNPANKAAADKPGQAVADELTITMAKPLVATKKPARAAAKTAKTSKAARAPKETEEAEGPLIQDPFGVEKKPAQ